MNEKIVIKTALLQPFSRVRIINTTRWPVRFTFIRVVMGYVRSVNSEKCSLKIIEKISGIVKYRTIFLFYSLKTVPTYEYIIIFFAPPPPPPPSSVYYYIILYFYYYYTCTAVPLIDSRYHFVLVYTIINNNCIQTIRVVKLFFTRTGPTFPTVDLF